MAKRKAMQSIEVSKTNKVTYLKPYPVTEPQPPDFPKKAEGICRYGYVENGNWIHFELPDLFDKWNPLQSQQPDDQDKNK